DEDACSRLSGPSLGCHAPTSQADAASKLVPRIRSSHQRVLQGFANFGIGTLAINRADASPIRFMTPVRAVRIRRCALAMQTFCRELRFAPLSRRARFLR